MSRKSLVLQILAASFWVVFPAFGQNFNLPDGPGKETVVAVCGGCHTMNRLGAGYTPEGWRMVVRMMLNFDVPIPEDQLASVTEYLAKAFPERPRPAAVINPGPVEVSIKEWPVATLGSRPHDPLAAKDGAIWYTGQLANVLGRLDPKTGQIKEYKLRTSDGEWLTMSEAATTLGVTHHCIRRLIKDGILPAEQVVPGAPYQIRTDDLATGTGGCRD